MTVTVILPQRELFRIPLVAIFVVVVHLIGDNSLNLLIGVTPGNQSGNLILHVTEEALLRCVIPAVSLPGHRLHEGSILELLDKGVAGIVAALIAMDDGRVAQRGSILAAHGVNHVKNEVDSEVATEPVSQHFMRTDVKDRGQITDTATVKDLGNVCQ